MKMKLFNQRSGRSEQYRRRLDSIESTYASVADADPDETERRLRRLRYGSPIRKQGTPAFDLGG